MNIYLFQQSQYQWDNLNQSFCNLLDIHYIPSLVQPLNHETFVDRYQKRNRELVLKAKLAHSRSTVLEYSKKKLSESKQKHNQYQITTKSA